MLRFGPPQSAIYKDAIDQIHDLVEQHNPSRDQQLRWNGHTVEAGPVPPTSLQSVLQKAYSTCGANDPYKQQHLDETERQGKEFTRLLNASIRDRTVTHTPVPVLSIKTITLREAETFLNNHKSELDLNDDCINQQADVRNLMR